MSLNNDTLNIQRLLLHDLINFLVKWILVFETVIWILFTNFEFSLSPIHKTLLLLLICSYLLSRGSNYFIAILLTFFVFSLSTLINFIFTLKVSFLDVSVAEILRIVMPFAVFIYFRKMVNDKMITLSYYRQFIWISFFVVSINLILGAFGMGNEQRSFGLGTRGFFNAGNDISTITIIVASFILSEKLKRGLWQFFFFFFFFFLLAYLLNTKATLVGLVIIALVLPIYDSLTNKLSVRKILKLGILGFLTPIIFSIIIIVLTKMNFWDRYLTFIDQFRNDDWLTFILSRRNENLIVAFEFVKTNFTIGNYIFGFNPGQFLLEIPERVEIDPFEIFFYYGLLGLLVVYLFFIKLLKNSLAASGSTHGNLFVYSRGLFACNVFLFLQSITAGHVLMSVLACVYLGVLNTIVFLPNEAN